MLTPPRACTLLGGTVLAAVLAAGLLPATAGAAKRAHPVSRCEDLRGMTVAATAIGLPTSGARVTLPEHAAQTPPYVDPYGSHMDGSHLLPTAAHCRVQGEITPVDSAAPPIRFNVNLPLQWNGRAIQSGGGGLGGAITTAPKNKSSGRFDPMPLNVPYPLNKGYVTFGSDNGHKAGDLEFIKNDEALRNWGGNEIKKTHDVAQRIVATAYGRPARHTFFIGESAGGREAMVAAQRFGGDYAGVIATSPILSWSAQNLAANNTRNHMVRGHLDAAAVKLLADHTRATCDAQDGLRDGIVATYLECRNDAIALRRPDGEPAAGCLSDDQVRTVNAIREPQPFRSPSPTAWTASRAWA
ncbi:tannase/feruloyl esterase family alpha/beta hydrolase [Streptomyces flavidovirens]|uniref:tannase/feruloyl esterase family alpha/beta hydrolase n=1 Tax=Streptomyces flavidovirens TaxID=67298 RepID=UPI00343E0BBB